MSPVVDHLAELTGFRDRDVLDVTLIGAFKDLLEPRAAAIYRCIGDSGAQRWLTRAKIRAGDAAATADSLWVDIDTLPKVQDWPHHHLCFESHEVVVVPGSAHLMLFPLATDREVVGVLEIESDTPITIETQRLVLSILRIYRNFEALLDYSERDALTGLLNRKTFDEAFMKTALGVRDTAMGALDGDRASEPGVQNYLGVIDIDHFKRVNDSFGHLMGDEVLLLLSRLMRASFRFHDKLYRFGGEEFVVLMRCNSLDEARQAFERLRSHVEQYAFPQVGRITVSVGFTEVDPSDSPSGAFERADRAVYFAKEHGRNQVRCYADLLTTGDLKEEAKVSDIEFF